MKKILLDEKYELGNGMGSWAKSFEADVINKGDVRFIGGVLMYATYIYRPKWYQLSATEVHWTPTDRNFNSFENLKIWLAKT